MGPTRRLAALLAGAAVIAGCGSGERLKTSLPRSPALLRVSSPEFINNSRLPKRYTCDGDGQEPPVYAGTTPVGTSELVLIMSDADAPGGTYVHVTRYGLSPRGDGAVYKGGSEGLNSAGDEGWTPPCPPSGSKTHHYVWKVYALRDPSGLDAGASPSEVVAALDEGVLAAGTITALYSR